MAKTSISAVKAKDDVKVSYFVFASKKASHLKGLMGIFWKVQL